MSSFLPSGIPDDIGSPNWMKNKKKKRNRNRVSCAWFMSNREQLSLPRFWKKAKAEDASIHPPQSWWHDIDCCRQFVVWLTMTMSIIIAREGCHLMTLIRKLSTDGKGVNYNSLLLSERILVKMSILKKIESTCILTAHHQHLTIIGNNNIGYWLLGS